MTVSSEACGESSLWLLMEARREVVQVSRFSDVRDGRGCYKNYKLCTSHDQKS